MGILSGLLGGAKPPKPPDLGALNQQQMEANKTAAYDVMGQNRYGQQTPFASNQWVTDPTTGQVTNVTSQSPEQAALYQKNNALAQQMAGGAGGALGSFMNQYWGGGGGGSSSSAGGGISVNVGGQQAGKIPGNIQKNLDYSKLTAMPGEDIGAARQEAQDALYGRAAGYLDPQWQQTEASTRTRLANQGLTPGTAAYDRAFANEQRAKEQAYTGARQDAIAGGGAEAARAQEMALQLRNQGVTEAGNLGAFHNAAQAQGAGQYLTDLGQQRQLSGQLGSAGISAAASMSNAAANNALQQRNEQFNELMALQKAGQGAQLLPQFGTSQGNLGNYGTGDAVGAASKDYQNQAAYNQAKNSGGLAGMIPGALGLAGTYFGAPLLGAGANALLGGLKNFGVGGGGNLTGMVGGGTGYGSDY